MLVFFKEYFAKRQIDRLWVVGSNNDTAEFIDKSYKNVLSIFEEHFKTTLLNKILSPALSILTFLELIAAGICMYGLFYSLLYQNTDFIFYGLVTSGIVLLMLLFGQRIAKDYVGAADITIYFILCAMTIMSYNIKG